MRRNIGIAVCLVVLMAIIGVVAYAAGDRPQTAAPDTPKLGKVIVLPEDGRAPYLEAIDAAQNDIGIEICVLEDPAILQHLQRALKRGVAVRAIVDRSTYDAMQSERDNLASYLTGSGGELHLSNPVFPRSFPQMILIDSKTFVYGSTCLDSTTFDRNRDFAQVTTDPDILQNALQLFGNDWGNSSPPGAKPPLFSPTPPMYNDTVMVSPTTSTQRLTQLFQSARTSLMVYTELLGNEYLEGQLAAAANRGVHVLVIVPKVVNGATPAEQLLQTASIAKLLRAGVEVHVSGPEESVAQPYMHARAAIVDDATAYLGSISLSPDSATQNREFGLVFTDPIAVARVRQVFGWDWQRLPPAKPPR